MVAQVEVGGDTLEASRKLLQSLVSQWTAENAARFGESYFREQPPGSFLLLVLQNGVRYDGDLSDRLIDLDLTIARHPELQHVRFHSVPVPNVGRAAVEAFMPDALQG